MKRTWKKQLAGAALAALLIALSASCANEGASASLPEEASSAAVSQTPPESSPAAPERGDESRAEETEASSALPRERGTLQVQSPEEAAAELERAIAALEQPELFDISALGEGWENPSMAMRNLYYGILSEHPEYKYAFELDTQRQENGLLLCTVSYMPYKTGNYPEDFEGLEIASLGELMAAAREHLDAKSVPVRITNPSLTVDDMSRALQQAGGGYLLCALNRDGTALTFTPQNGLSQEEALAVLEQTNALAEQVCASCVTPGMTKWEQAEALYTWLTENVRYDQRYYADFANMPYASTTAYGALADGTAICGGYAQALQLLFEKAGIPCVTVSGSSSGENHMWNLAFLDGAWQYFDATSDRGMAQFGFRKFAVPADALTGYVWDADWAQRLAASVGETAG